MRLHVTFLTEDIDRAAAFHERVLDARKTLDLTEQGDAPPRELDDRGAVRLAAPRL